MIHKFIKYLTRQVTQIQQGGVKVLYRKIRLVTERLFFNLASIPFVLLIRLLQPVIKVRFILIDAGRIGHFETANVYLARKKNGEFPSGILDIVYFDISTGQVANEQYLKMWKRALHPTPLIFSRLLKSIDKLNERLPGEKIIYHPGRVQYTSDHNKAINNEITENILRHVDSPISFTPDEQVLGKKLLFELGIHDDKQFICFHSRDSAYLDNLKIDRDWRYHNFRDSNICNYLPAVEEMTKRKYYAVRMGSHVKQSLDVDNPKIIDYATNGRRSDFLDIYLSANCRIFLLSDTGLSNPPEVFRKPIVYVNDFLFALLHRASVRNGLFIFKRFHSLKEKRYITFHEILSLKNDGFEYNFNKQIDKGEIYVVDNTPDEILSVTIEMDERLKGTWETNEEDEALQAQFWSLLPSNLLKSPNCRIGAQFLRDNREMLNS